MFPIETYEKVSSVREAVRLLGGNPEAVLIAGGTDVLVRLREGRRKYRHLVDIHDLSEIKGVCLEWDGTVVLGSGTTFAELMSDPIVARHLPVLAEAAATVAGPQIRNVATLGGNLCNGAPSADSAAPLLVLNARVVLEGPGGIREIPLHEFYQGPGRVDRLHAEILTSVRVAPADHRGWSAAHTKYSQREAMDIATIGCAAACRVEGERVDLRLAFTVAGPTPLRCWKTEERVRGARADGECLRLVSDSVLEDLQPRDSWRASREFREHLIRTLAERVTRTALERSGVFL